VVRLRWNGRAPDGLGAAARPGRPTRVQPANTTQEPIVTQLYTSLYTLVAFTSDRLKKEAKGATAVEYGLMVGLIAAVIIGSVILLGGKLDGLFNSIQKQLPGTTPAATTGN
jgi:pilus assembly protein Flp/PilA